MLRKCFAVFLVIFALGNLAACTSSPEDRGDVSGRNEQNTPHPN